MQRLRTWLWTMLLVLLLAPPLLLLPFRWVPVPVTSFMIQARIAAWVDDKPHPGFSHDWVPWTAISPQLARAVITAEDQGFVEHSGFDIEALIKAYRHNQNHRRVRGGSTISQQLAKNLFLWPGRSYIRKAYESYVTVWLELLWPKRRILEVYLNSVEFGDQTYGAEAAARRYFHKPASRLTAYEAASMAAVLPAPQRWRLERPGPYVRNRAARIAGHAVPLPAELR